MALGQTTNKPAEPKKLANIDADQTNTNQLGLIVPYVRGRRRIAGHYFTPPYNPTITPVKTQVGKGDEQTTGFKYSSDLGMLICFGGRARVSRLFRHIIDQTIAWENAGGLAAGANPSEPVMISKRGQTWIYWGSFDQPVDPHILTPRGAAPTTPGFNPRDPNTWPDSDQTVIHPPQ